jgi:hypothetical protein
MAKLKEWSVRIKFCFKLGGKKCCGKFQNVESGFCKRENETAQFLASIRSYKNVWSLLEIPNA